MDTVLSRMTIDDDKLRFYYISNNFQQYTFNEAVEDDEILFVYFP